MTVRDLLAELQHLPRDLEVLPVGRRETPTYPSLAKPGAAGPEPRWLRALPTVAIHDRGHSSAGGRSHGGSVGGPGGPPAPPRRPVPESLDVRDLD